MQFTVRLIQPSILEEQIRFTKVYRLNFFIFVVIISGAVYTIQYQDLLTAFTATIVISGIGQVNFYCFQYALKLPSNLSNLTSINQAFVKMMMMMDLRSLVDILNHFAKVYKRNSKPNERDYDLCQSYAALSRSIVIAVPIVYNLVLLFYQLPKLYQYLITGDLEPTIGVYFPKMDQLGLLGAIFTNAFNIGAAYAAGSVLIPIDMIIYLVFANIMLSSAMIQREVEEWRMVLEIPDSSEQEIKRKAAEIIQMHQVYNE